MIIQTTFLLFQNQKINGVEDVDFREVWKQWLWPYWLKDVLTRLPTQRASEIDELLPHNWSSSDKVWWPDAYTPSPNKETNHYHRYKQYYVRSLIFHLSHTKVELVNAGLGVMAPASALKIIVFMPAELIKYRLLALLIPPNSTLMTLLQSMGLKTLISGSLKINNSDLINCVAMQSTVIDILCQPLPIHPSKRIPTRNPYCIYCYDAYPITSSITYC